MRLSFLFSPEASALFFLTSCDLVTTLGRVASEKVNVGVKDYRDEEVVIELQPHHIFISRVNILHVRIYFTREHTHTRGRGGGTQSEHVAS